MIDLQDFHYIKRKIDINRFQDTTILITGATGFLGRNIVNFFVHCKVIGELRCSIIAVCRSQKKAHEVFKQDFEHDIIEFIFQDITEYIPTEREIDYILHAACKSSSEAISINPVEVIRANMLGVDNLIRLGQVNKVKAILFFSSGAVYGETIQASGPIREDDAFPIEFFEEGSSYSISKKAAESLCYSYFKEYNVPIKMVRISHTYGPGIDLEDGHIYSDFTKSILNGEDLIIKGDGMNQRTFCYVADAVWAFLLILLDGESGQAYNMANTSQYYSIRELADKLADEAFKELGIKVKCMKPGGKKITEYPMDIEKIRQLGWEPEIDVVEGFRRTVESYRG